MFEPLKNDHFDDFLAKNQNISVSENFVTPQDIEIVISKLNKKSSCGFSDFPMMLINIFSKELSNPLCNLANTMFESGVYPNLWKRELITPVPKVYPPPSISKLRPISGMYNFAKIADKILANMMIQDMAEKSDPTQYGNTKGLSVNHYLIDMIHKISLSLDKNSASRKKSSNPEYD